MRKQMGKKLTPAEKILRSKETTRKITDNFYKSVENVKEGVFVSPIYLPMPRVSKADKKCALNMNSYRNWQFHMSNQLKIKYKEWMRGQLEGKIFNTPIEITYTLYWSHKPDLMNVVSIVDKFFCDALQAYGCIPDDNVDHLTNIYTANGGKDSEYPRCEITIL